MPTTRLSSSLSPFFTQYMGRKEEEERMCEIWDGDGWQIAPLPKKRREERERLLSKKIDRKNHTFMKVISKGTLWQLLSSVYCKYLDQ